VSQTPLPRSRSADLTAAWATGAGGGAVALMVVWLVAARVTDALISQPAAAITALTVAIVAAGVVTAGLGARLAHSVDQPSPSQPAGHGQAG
jgi:hypothetical protein